MSRSRSRLFGRSFLIVVILLLGCGVLGLLFGQKVDASDNDDAKINDSLRQFTEVYSLVEQNYAEPVKADKAIYDGAIPGMLHTLDPHSNFFDPKAFAALTEEQSGKYYGVGMEIGPRGDKVVVVAPFVGAPAYKAGIRAGDLIIAIDGKPTDNMSTSDVADMVKGPRGTKVRVTILREGVTKPMDFVITRDEIPRKSVDVHFLVRPGIGYMHVASFMETTDTEVESALASFGNIDGLILDLRGDPGGLLKEAVGMADKFLPKGSVIVSQRGRSSPEIVYHARHGNDGKDFPVVILVDRGTASAAEIVTGAMQDHDRALVLGENTFGKGLVQTVYPLSDHTGLALTTAKYYTPSGRLIQRNYTGVSLYDYYYRRNDDKNPPHTDVKTTDSGRTVYGGDGITPDVKYATPVADNFQNELLQKYLFFDFARQYTSKHPITPSFQVDDAVLQDFRNFLTSKQISFNEADLQKDLNWVKMNIRSEVFVDQLGMEASLRARAEGDPEVAKAVELLPQARALLQSAQRVIAERRSAAASQR
jgi:carboxyl-terminal processing protease